MSEATRGFQFNGGHGWTYKKEPVSGAFTLEFYMRDIERCDEAVVIEGNCVLYGSDLPNDGQLHLIRVTRSSKDGEISVFIDGVQP